MAEQPKQTERTQIVLEGAIPRMDLNIPVPATAKPPATPVGQQIVGTSPQGKK